ncbi:unnamed protein product [Orchesella dallaii]|uniref:Gustatory receptor n=1 Tax=Orchesella dallaii TaxID=48710 RepID=A0ABP1QTF5_9HEXA
MALVTAALMSLYRRSLVWFACYAIVDFIPFPIGMIHRDTSAYMLFTIGFIFQRIVIVFELLIFCIILSVYDLAKLFQKQTKRTFVPQEMLIVCMELRTLFMELNDIFETAFLFHYGSTLLFYIRSAILTKMPLEPDKSYNLIYIMVHSTIYFSACEIHSLVRGSMKGWIYKRKISTDISHIDLTKLSILAGEVENDPIGISCKFFSISYGIMGSISCLLIQVTSQGFLVIALRDAVKQITVRVEAWAVLAFVSHIFDATLQLLAIHTFWCRRKEIQTLMNKLQKGSSSYMIKATRMKWLRIFQGPEVVIVWAYVAFLMAGLLQSYRRKLVWSTASNIVDHFLIFPGSRFINRDILLYPICGVTFFLERVNSAIELYILAAALSMYELGKQFQRQIQQDITTPKDLMEAHRDLKNVVDRFNSIFARLFLTHYICILLNYVSTPAMLTRLAFGWDKVSFKMVYIGIHFVIYFCCCEVHSMVKSIVLDWIHHCKLKADTSSADLVKLSILTAEVEYQPVGISCNFFVINYGLMGSFLGLLATYAIFAWQMQTSGMK